MSILAEFDDLKRCVDALTDCTAEEEFLKCVVLLEEYRLQWLKAVEEAQRLQQELDASLRNMDDLEKKLFHARKFVEIERKARNEAEHERKEMERKIAAVSDILKYEKNINERTREQIAILNSYPKKRKSRHGDDQLGNEINSTGSFLSDLSLTTQSEEDFLDSRAHRQWKKPRPSQPRSSDLFVGTRRSRLSTDNKKTGRSSNKCMEIGVNDKIVAHTRVSIPPAGEGPIKAESIIEAIPQKSNKKCGLNGDNFQNENKLNIGTPSKKSPKRSYFAPSAPPLHELNTKLTPNHMVRMMRSHNFVQKTFMKSDICSQCQKKLRFGFSGWKCQDCRVCVHPSCRDLLKISCVPQSNNTNGALASITDFAPKIRPKIPALIVHCVNEIETRGLNEIGLYRVSGSEREVKQLKEKFLHNKCTPNLSNIDVHVLCGCIKDFLRSLNEPLIPTNLWKEFSNAVQNISCGEIKNLYMAIDLLPEANRDTLAFLILHFQRVADCLETKMPKQNIAKIFGPTIVGFSSAKPDQQTMYIETLVTFNVIEALMDIPTDYWSQFVAIEYEKDQHLNYDEGTPRTDDSKLTYGKTMEKLKKRQRKFYATPPYPSSAKK